MTAVEYALVRRSDLDNLRALLGVDDHDAADHDVICDSAHQLADNASEAIVILDEIWEDEDRNER